MKDWGKVTTKNLICECVQLCLLSFLCVYLFGIYRTFSYLSIYQFIHQSIHPNIYFFVCISLSECIPNCHPSIQLTSISISMSTYLSYYLVSLWSSITITTYTFANLYSAYGPFSPLLSPLPTSPPTSQPIILSVPPTTFFLSPIFSYNHIFFFLLPTSHPSNSLPPLFSALHPNLVPHGWV